MSAQVSGAAAEGARAAQHFNAGLLREDLNQALVARGDAPEQLTPAGWFTQRQQAWKVPLGVTSRSRRTTATSPPTDLQAFS